MIEAIINSSNFVLTCITKSKRSLFVSYRNQYFKSKTRTSHKAERRETQQAGAWQQSGGAAWQDTAGQGGAERGGADRDRRRAASCDHSRTSPKPTEEKFPRCLFGIHNCSWCLFGTYLRIFWIRNSHILWAAPNTTEHGEARRDS